MSSEGPDKAIQEITNDEEEQLIAAITGESAFMATDTRLIFSEKRGLFCFPYENINILKIIENEHIDHPDGPIISITTETEDYDFRSENGINAVIKQNKDDYWQTSSWDTVIESIMDILDTWNIESVQIS